jgi:hypothetical protein
MFGSHFQAGLAALRRRPGLALLLFAMQLALAFILTLPLYFTLNEIVGPTGFSDDLARQFDIVLWFDIMEKVEPMLGGLLWQVLLAGVLLLVWHAASGVGLVHALRAGGGRSFWQGVGRFTGPGLLLALLFLLLAFAWLIPVGVVNAAVKAVWAGTVGEWWTNNVLTPTLFIAGIAVLDLMHDYARAALVIDEAPVGRAWRTGIGWPFRHGVASWLYLAWFVPGLGLWLLPTVVDLSFAAAWVPFLVQQGCLLARAFVTVGWVGSAVSLFEEVRLQEMPLIASAAPDGEEAPPEALAEDMPAETPVLPAAAEGQALA